MFLQLNKFLKVNLFISIILWTSWLNTSCHQASSNNQIGSVKRNNEDSLRSAEIYKKIAGPEKHRKLDSFFQYKV